MDPSIRFVHSLEPDTTSTEVDELTGHGGTRALQLADARSKQHIEPFLAQVYVGYAFNLLMKPGKLKFRPSVM